jgi:hypothetical protein
MLNPLNRLTSARTAAAAAVGTGVLVTGGVAAAATGSLPGAAQDTAREMLAHVGVTVPGADEHSAGRADGRGSSADHVSTIGGGAGAPGESAAGQAGKGHVVSEMAKTTDATGVEKGAEISEYASGGHSHAGEDHPAEMPEGPAPGGDSGGKAQVETPNSGGADRPDDGNTEVGQEHAGQADPNSGGTGTADGASEGHSSAGTQTADTASDGHSTAGSQNAAGDRP